MQISPSIFQKVVYYVNYNSFSSPAEPDFSYGNSCRSCFCRYLRGKNALRRPRIAQKQNPARALLEIKAAICGPEKANIRQRSGGGPLPGAGDR